MCYTAHADQHQSYRPPPQKKGGARGLKPTRTEKEKDRRKSGKLSHEFLSLAIEKSSLLNIAFALQLFLQWD